MKNNLSIDEFEIVDLNENQSPSEFFSYCLTHRLFKDEEGFSSRMKNVYSHKKDWMGLSAVIAKKENIPIGICLVEKKLDKNSYFMQEAGILKMGRTHAKNPWLKQLGWHFIHGGFISFFVKIEHRGKGVANSMMQEMEKLQYEIISNKYSEKENCISMTCRELACDILKKSKLFYPIQCQPEDNNYGANISSHSYSIYFEDQPKRSLGSFLPKKLKVYF